MIRYTPSTHDLQQMSIAAVGVAVVWALNASWWALVPWMIGPVFFIWKMHRWRITQSPKPSVKPQ